MAASGESVMAVFDASFSGEAPSPEALRALTSPHWGEVKTRAAVASFFNLFSPHRYGAPFLHLSPVGRGRPNGPGEGEPPTRNAAHLLLAGRFV